MSFFNNIKNKAKENLNKIPDEIEKKEKKEIIDEKFKNPYEKIEDYPFIEDNDYNNTDFYDYDEFQLPPTQKSESFHFFILENQYRDLERLIRGVKDVWNKEENKWVTKRKAEHCFIDEEAEDIVRTAQSHLSSDLKLAFFSKEEYPLLLNQVFDQLWELFYSIMEYRFGRFGNATKQQKMKLQAINIFNMLMMRIKANYSRAIGGSENKLTHDSVKGQESLQHTERRDYNKNYT